ncbi:MAG TPA: ABC transporter ATP-binding protein [Dehalococcoidia bacterium]|nr:ABC transporter ATP-binding protein [Dehalococcoidia bacterium]
MKLEARQPAVEAQGLRKVYNRKAAVEDLSLTVGRGEVFGFLGPNGAGKTTSLKMLLGLVVPTSGTGRLLGKPLGEPEARRQVGFLPEHFRFHEWLKAAEFLHFHGRLYGMEEGRRDKKVREALAIVGLSDCAGQRLSTFSKGMLQRIGIAQALLNDPELVFLDEPTSGLDPLGRRQVRDIILAVRERGVTVFLNSHLLSEAERVCDRVAIINKGSVVRQGALSELLSGDLEVDLRLANLTPELLEALGRLSSQVKTDGSVVTVRVAREETIPLLAEAAVQGGGRLLALTPRRSSLEDYFVQVIEGSG